MQDQKNNEKVRFDLEQRKVLLSASLVSVIALISLTNQSLFSKRDVSDSRMIASNSQFVKVDYGQLEWQKQLAAELANKKEREPTSVGQRPSPFEQLRFGFFEGKYAFQLEHGKIRTIDFVDSDFTHDRPKYINDKLRFLRDWQDLFMVEFSTAEKESEGVERSLIRERYRLLAGGQIVGYAQFLSDVHGRAHAIKIESKN